MAFGLLITKWCILNTPVNVKLSNLKKLLSAVVRLHNYCIDNQEPSMALKCIYKVPANQQHAHEPTQLGYIPTDAPNVISREGSSHLREILAKRVADKNLEHPISATTKRALQQQRLAMYK
jgi:hypothetical protein